MKEVSEMLLEIFVYCKYYEVVCNLFHIGMSISEFCGFTLKDIDIEKRMANIDHQ